MATRARARGDGEVDGALPPASFGAASSGAVQRPVEAAGAEVTVVSSDSEGSSSEEGEDEEEEDGSNGDSDGHSAAAADSEDTDAEEEEEGSQSMPGHPHLTHIRECAAGCCAGVGCE